MPMNGTTWGDAVETALEGLSIPQDAFLTSAQLKQIWETICGQHVTHIDGFADIDLTAGDIPVAPGSFKDSTNSPISGVGSSEAVTLNGRIK